jgi:hypothetical protein
VKQEIWLVREGRLLHAITAEVFVTEAAEPAPNLLFTL